MVRPVSVLLVGLSLAAELAQRQSVGASSLAGRVVDAASGKAIAAATVRLSQTRGGYRSEVFGTNADGRFSFTGLAAGSFTIQASAKTYLDGAVGRRRPLGEEVWVTLGAAERRDDLTIPMFRAAVLSGRVVDESGIPVAGFTVQAWPRSRRPFLFNDVSHTAWATTNGNGEYQMTDVVPGEYVVVAQVYHSTHRQGRPGPSPCDPPIPTPPWMPTPPPPATAPAERPEGSLYSRLTSGLRQPPPLADGTRMTYSTVFYPGLREMAAASSVRVGAGESPAQAGYGHDS